MLLLHETNIRIKDSYKLKDSVAIEIKRFVRIILFLVVSSVSSQTFQNQQYMLLRMIGGCLQAATEQISGKERIGKMDLKFQPSLRVS